MNLSIHLALLLMGFTFTVTQVMVIRELLVVFIGNELSIAIILANWLLLMAAGSFFLGKKIKEQGTSKGSYALLQLLLSILLPLTIYGIRCLRDIMGLSTGEAASLLQMFAWTFPLLAPLGIVNGILFALGCQIYSHFILKSSQAIGRVYLLEALGAGAGGILYTFVLIPYFSSFQVAFLMGAANLISALLLVVSAKPRERRPGFLSGILGLAFVLNGTVLLFFGSSLEKSSRDRQWRGLQVVDSRWSPYGNVTVGRRGEQMTFFSNGIPLCNVPVPDIAFVEELVHYPLLLIPDPRNILIVGGGLGGVIREVLKHPVEKVHYAEIDPLLIQLVKENPTPLTRQELKDPKVHVHGVDGRWFMRTTSEKFDGILLNLPGPFTLELNRFYTVEFFKEASRVLQENGWIALALPGSERYLSPELRDLIMSLKASLRHVFPSVHMLPGDRHLILASPSAQADPLLPEPLIARLQERKIATGFVTDFQIRLKLETQRRKWLEDSLRRGGDVKINQDAFPLGLYYAIAYWNAQFHPSFQIFWGKLRGLHIGHFLLLLLIIFSALFLAWRKSRNRERVALGWVVTTTGFFGIAISILLILSFQTLYGYAYQWIGVLIAAFMVGLALGSWKMDSAMKRIRGYLRALLGLEVLILIFLGVGAILLFLFYNPWVGQRMPGLIKCGLPFLTLIGGFLVGLEFFLSNYIYSINGEEVGRTAGILYAADLFGAWAGSLLAGVLLVPILGILQTFIFLLLLKGTSLLLLFIAGRQSRSKILYLS